MVKKYFIVRQEKREVQRTRLSEQEDSEKVLEEKCMQLAQVKFNFFGILRITNFFIFSVMK